MANITLERTPSQIKLKRLLAILEAGECSRTALAKKLSVSDPTVDRYLKHLRAVGKVYIKRWQRNVSAGPTAFFSLGDFKDAPRPKAFNKAEQSRRSYAMMKRHDPEKYISYLEKARHRARVKHRKERGLPLALPDPLMAWVPRRDLKEAA